MSNRIFQAVWDCGPQSRSEMLVLMVLADSADAETATCFPSLRRIADGARMSIRTAQYTLRALEADGWISIADRPRANGSQASSLYTISLDKLGLETEAERRAKWGAKTAGRGAKTAPPPPQNLHPTGGAKSAPLEHSIYNKEPAALNLDDLSSHARTCLSRGEPLPMGGGRQVFPSDPAYQHLSDLLRKARA